MQLDTSQSKLRATQHLLSSSTKVLVKSLRVAATSLLLMALQTQSSCAFAKSNLTMRALSVLLCLTSTAKIRPNVNYTCQIQVAWTSVPCWRSASTPNGREMTAIPTGETWRKLRNHLLHLWRKLTG